MTKKLDCMDYAERVLEILSAGPTTATDLAPHFGLCSRDMGSALAQMQNRKMVEKAGYASVGHGHKAVLWAKFNLASSATARLAPPSGPAIPNRVYRSPLAQFLGEPAIGFSALDQRDGRLE